MKKCIISLLTVLFLIGCEPDVPKKPVIPPNFKFEVGEIVYLKVNGLRSIVTHAYAWDGIIFYNIKTSIPQPRTVGTLFSQKNIAIEEQRWLREFELYSQKEYDKEADRIESDTGRKKELSDIKTIAKELEQINRDMAKYPKCDHILSGID